MGQTSMLVMWKDGHLCMLLPTGNLAMVNMLIDEGASLVAINHDDKMPIDVSADSDIKYILQQRMLEAGEGEGGEGGSEGMGRRKLEGRERGRW